MLLKHRVLCTRQKIPGTNEIFHEPGVCVMAVCPSDGQGRPQPGEGIRIKFLQVPQNNELVLCLIAIKSYSSGGKGSARRGEGGVRTYR